MSDNWVVQNLENALETWNEKLSEIWTLITTTPQNFKGGNIWKVIVDINGAVQAIGLITVLSFILIMTVYGRFFKLYMYTALAPIPLSTFAGEPTQNVGKSFIKSYCAVLLEGAVIVLACIIFSVFASSPPVVNPDAAAVTQVWAYIGELVFNMLVLVGAVKMSDRIIREMMGL